VRQCWGFKGLTARGRGGDVRSTRRASSATSRGRAAFCRRCPAAHDPAAAVTYPAGAVTSSDGPEVLPPCDGRGLVVLLEIEQKSEAVLLLADDDAFVGKIIIEAEHLIGADWLGEPLDLDRRLFIGRASIMPSISALDCRRAVRLTALPTIA
jgi:hypothetical protein